MTDTNSERARPLVARRGIDLVLFCKNNDFSKILAPDGEDTLYARLKRQAPPVWLRPIALPKPVGEMFDLYSAQPAD